MKYLELNIFVKYLSTQVLSECYAYYNECFSALTNNKHIRQINIVCRYCRHKLRLLFILTYLHAQSDFYAL